jgi:hypothetical protein
MVGFTGATSGVGTAHPLARRVDARGAARPGFPDPVLIRAPRVKLSKPKVKSNT